MKEDKVTQLVMGSAVVSLTLQLEPVNQTWTVWLPVLL